MNEIIYPQNITLKDWADNLVGSYSHEFLPILDEHDIEEKWKAWGAIVAGTGFFARANIPAPFEIKEGKLKDNFTSWEEWARTVYAIINNELIPE